MPTAAKYPEEIFSLAAGVAAALAPRQGTTAGSGKKSHQGIFLENSSLRISATWVKWSGTHQVIEWRESEIALGPTIYLYDGLDLIEELDNSGNVLARYNQGPGLDQPLSMLRAGTTSYYQQDGLASVSSLSNAASALTNTYSYDSFGKLAASTGSVVNPFQFTGREFDQESGQYFYRTRYYDQNIGRFASEDTVHFRGGLNFYEYALNRPTQFVDPTGKVSIAPGFSPNCLADLLNALQLLKNRPPACDCWFRSHGLGLSLEQMIANPSFTINYDPNHDYSEGGATLGYTWKTPFDIYLTVDACNSGPNHIAQDLVHEFAHLTLGHFGLHKPLSNFEHNKVRQVENTCGFAIQTQGTSITVTAQ